MSVRSLIAGAALAMVLAAPQSRATTPLPVPAAYPAGFERDASLDDYRQHLLDLTAIVQACAKARDTLTCNPELVGPDDRIPLAGTTERRLIRYAWLRALLAKADVREEAETKPAAPAQNNQARSDVLPAPPTTSELLRAAETRLSGDLAQSQQAAPPADPHAEQRAAMKQVLAGRDFRRLQAPTARDAALERIGNWLNRLFAGAARLRARSAWVGRLIVWGFILAVFAALAWALLQLERLWRIRLAPEMDSPAPRAASARNWQLWLDDARRSATAGQWREAVHFVYWAAISRLESRRLWPADRARTPREYLALVSAEDPRRPGLARLTATFERIWYGGRAAGESDYRKAEELATALISTGSQAGGEQ